VSFYVGVSKSAVTLEENVQLAKFRIKEMMVRGGVEERG